MEIVIKWIGFEYIVVFIIEFIVGVVGVVFIFFFGYYEVIREICDKYDVLWIVDEVMIGVGCIGVMFVYEYWGVKSDIMMFGKGVGVGYMLIVVMLVSSKMIEFIMNGFKLIMSGYMLSVNLLLFVIGIVVLIYIEKYDFV